MSRPLRFSERKRLSESGSLGDLEEGASQTLRNAVWLYVSHAKARAPDDVRKAFDLALADALGRHFGDSAIDHALLATSTEDFLDGLEILAEEGVVPWQHRVLQGGGYRGAQFVAVLLDAQDHLNNLFDRHRFGFRFDSEGVIQPIASPLLHEVVVGPALLAVARPGWEEVDRTYREAVLHQRRADEARDALTLAAAAVEAALKASGYRGATLGVLAADFRRSPVAVGYSPQIVEHLSELLEQLMAWRSRSGSAHGQAPGADDPPTELVALAIHWAGAFIVYLAAATPST